VEFKTPEGYKAAVAASPFQIGDEKFWVEERRNAGPGNRQQQFQGGRGGFNRGRGGFGGQRGGRGGAGGSVRGRGGAQAA